MENRTIGIGVIGSGRIGTLRANMASRHPSVRFLAVSDLDPLKAHRLAEAVSADVSTADNLEVIANPRVDAVFVSTPEHDHLESFLQAIEFGKLVFVEKPIALSLDDAAGQPGRRADGQMRRQTALLLLVASHCPQARRSNLRRPRPHAEHLCCHHPERSEGSPLEWRLW